MTLANDAGATPVYPQTRELFDLTLLGLCPVIIASHSAASGFLLSSLLVVVLVVSGLCMLIIKPLIDRRLQVVCGLVVSGTVVTVLDLLCSAYLLEMRLQFGIYLPLLAVNCLVLYCCQGMAARPRGWPLTVPILLFAITPVAIGTGIGLLRQTAGAAAMAASATINAAPGAAGLAHSAWPGPAVLDKPAGLFFLLGLICAGINLCTNRVEDP